MTSDNQEQKIEAILAAIPWRCFYCDFITSNPEEAEAHFGERDDAEEFKPICKWWSQMDDQERLKVMQSYTRDLTLERNKNDRQRIAIEGLEYQVNLLYHKDFNGYKPFREGKVTTVYEAFCLYDSMEGRALAAEEELKKFQTMSKGELMT
jgi:hypothetical protein